MTFQNFSFDKRIYANLKACGYENPTPIQDRTIPLILQGHDVMGLAQTGTGKTAAFALPILQRLLGSNLAQKTPQILVLAPTRELAMQINENFNEFARNTGIHSAVVMGGVAMGPQIRASRTAQIVVACPGRLVALNAANNINLSGINTLVLDEADRMLDMGFMPDIKRILAALPEKRQNLLFSATMPDSIRTLTKRILNDPKTVRIDTQSAVTSIEHVFYKTQKMEKTVLLEKLIKKADFQSMLIFTRTKHKAKNLARRLSQNGLSSTFLQGNMSQGQREKALDGFRTGRFPIMVATDIASRGIDCERITHVINFDVPDTVETYTHRIGRTGRAGRSGSAISLVTDDDASQVRAIQRGMKLTAKVQSFGALEGQGKSVAPVKSEAKAGKYPEQKVQDAAKKSSPKRRRRRRPQAA